MKRILHVLIFLVSIFTIGTSDAQTVIYNDGATISVDGATMVVNGGDYENTNQSGASFLRLENNGQVEVSGSVTNADLISVIAGRLVINGDYSDGGNPNTYFFCGDSVIIYGDFGNGDGVFDTDTTQNSVLVFGDSNPRVMTSNDLSDYEHIVFDGGGSKTISGKWNVYEVKFRDGVVNQFSSSDTFYLVENGTVLDQNTTSYYNGQFWNEGSGTLDFPIGNGADWRPIRILNSATLATIGMEVSPYSPAPYSPTPGVNVTGVTDRRYWKATELTTTYSGGQVMVLFDPADTIGTGASTLAELAVVQSDSTSPYNSIGNSVTTNEPLGMHTITSDLVAGQDFITIGGGCSNIKVDIKAFLEGGYNSGPDMVSELNFIGHVDAAYSNNGPGVLFTGNQGMYPGYNMPLATPADAIDVIALILREGTNPFNRVDTAYVWLMEDGSIRDFWSGTSNYATFCGGTVGQDYYLEIQHRNHLPVMNNTTFTASTAVPGSAIDFTSDLNIYGGGGVVQKGVDFYIASGNTNGDWSVNGIDRFQILVDQGSLVTGYTDTNVDFNDGVDISDDQLGQANSLMLMYSTAP